MINQRQNFKYLRRSTWSVTVTWAPGVDGDNPTASQIYSPEWSN